MINKKQSYTLIEDICKINKAWGNTPGSYDDALQSSMQIEEALEGFDTPGHGMTLDSDTPKEMSRHIMTWATIEGGAISDVDRFDKHLDSIYLNYGALFQLGLTPAQMVEGLQVVHEANLQKLHAPKDDKGKITKPTDFTPPEDRLQAILDARS